jgi:hypothetical protein
VPDFTDEDIAAMSRVSDEDYDEAPAAIVPEELDVEISAADSAGRPPEPEGTDQETPAATAAAAPGAAEEGDK